jgi:hypothetical protein
VKSALGPNGRGNPIIKLINANTDESKYATSLEGKSRGKSSQNRRPRIISVIPSGIAYLWELDLSFDLNNYDILNFHIPPPLVSFDGLVAAVSCKGLPVKFPPALSPTSIASLSPSSLWDQTDDVNSQFEVSYDSHQNVLCWVFSPDCVGSSLKPRASREERLNMNGALVVWNLDDIPQPEFPPAVLPPHSVQQLPRSEGGRVTADMTVPICLSDPFLVTIYITSSNELMATSTNLNKGNSIQVESRVSVLADLSGHSCLTVATARVNSPLILVGTQYGILFATIAMRSDDALLFLLDESRNEHSPRSTGKFNSKDSRMDDATEIFSTAKVEVLETGIDTLRDNLVRANAELEGERLNNITSTLKLPDAEDKADVLEKQMQQGCECDVSHHRQNGTKKNAENMATEPLRDNNLTEADTSLDILRKELSDAKEMEDSLRGYITLLEKTLSAKDDDLVVAIRQTQELTRRNDGMAAVVVEQQSEQQLTIDSLVDLLENQRIDHENYTTAHRDEIRRLEDELSKLKRERDSSMAAIKDKLESSTELILTMTVELQNTRNELDTYRLKHRSQHLSINRTIAFS